MNQRLVKTVTLSFLALFSASIAHATAKRARTPANVNDCTEAAGRHVESYMKENLGGKAFDAGLHHKLYKKFSGKNGYGQLVYTYMFQLTDDKGTKKGIVRVTENHKCAYTTIGQYKDEEDMNSDDSEAAQDGAEEGQP